MNAFLVHFEHFLVFVEDDPRANGCIHHVDDVLLDEANLLDPLIGQIPVGACVGRDPVDDHHYRVFRSPRHRAEAGFRQVVGMPVATSTWDEFVRVATDCGELVG
jgi:hypothetical protein